MKSPSLKAKYQNLYAQLNVWAQESGDPQELAKYGVNVEQLAGADKKVIFYLPAISRQ